MPTPEAERAARARGDVVRARLGPMAGALVAAGLVIELGAERVGRALQVLARSAWSSPGAPGDGLAAALSLLSSALWPTLLAALLGALGVGLLQTRGFVGRPGLDEPPERATPNPALALIGWVALVALALDLLRASFGLVAGAEPSTLGAAAVGLARTLGRALFIAVAALAFVDHLLRTRARRERLDGGVPNRRRASPPSDEPSTEALLDGVERVLFDQGVAVTLGRRDGVLWAFARARGLSALALVDGARRRGLPVRAAPAARLDPLMLGEPVPAGTLVALRLEAGA
jgi:hypothetical protein